MEENKQLHAGDAPYDENFYRAQKDDSYKAASVVLPLVAKFVYPQTVVDVGCGVGTWLAVWKKLGAKILGIDGDYVDRSQLFIDPEEFHSANLEEKIHLNKKFALVQTLEVAEHLSRDRAESFVDDLTNLGDVILFGAAVIGQGGTNHVNEQMQSYWAEKFLRRGYVGIDCLRPQIWADGRIAFYYRQNTILYVKNTELYHYPELQKFYLEHKDGTIFDAVHPEMWIGRLIAFQNFQNQVQAHLTSQNLGGGDTH